MTDEMSRAGRFVSARFDASKPLALPFSFTYDGRASSELLKNWTITRRTANAGKDCIERTLTCTDPATGLRISCTLRQFRDLPAVEWVLHRARRL
jgi:hypothetical protein